MPRFTRRMIGGRRRRRGGRRKTMRGGYNRQEADAAAAKTAADAGALLMEGTNETPGLFSQDRTFDEENRMLAAKAAQFVNDDSAGRRFNVAGFQTNNPAAALYVDSVSTLYGNGQGFMPDNNQTERTAKVANMRVALEEIARNSGYTFNAPAADTGPAAEAAAIDAALAATAGTTAATAGTTAAVPEEMQQVGGGKRRRRRRRTHRKKHRKSRKRTRHRRRH